MKRESLLWPRYYDVVVLPPPPVRDMTIRLSQKLYKTGGQWKLGKVSFLPHISIYHIPILQKDFEPFTRRLQQIVDSAAWGTLETTGFDLPVVTVSRPKWLLDLNRRVVRETVGFFDRTYGAEKMWRLHRFKEHQLQMAEKYLRDFGTPMFGVNFQPHMTLTSFNGAEPSNILLDVPRMEFAVDRLHICELGISHSCQRIVRELLPH
jgi:hypothetical protein